MAISPLARSFVVFLVLPARVDRSENCTFGLDALVALVASDLTEWTDRLDWTDGSDWLGPMALSGRSDLSDPISHSGWSDQAEQLVLSGQTEPAVSILGTRSRLSIPWFCS